MESARGRCLLPARSRPGQDAEDLRRRQASAGFEEGLVFILVPVMSLWLDISPAAAFVATWFVQHPHAVVLSGVIDETAASDSTPLS
jgi:hypothetical protein